MRAPPTRRHALKINPGSETGTWSLSRAIPLFSLIYNRDRDATSQSRRYPPLGTLEFTGSMARIYPFRALRYNPSRVHLEDVVTQPWDKITPSMQQAYYQRSPYNLVRIVLGLPELFDRAPGADGNAPPDIYSRAARDFADWRAQGVLSREKEPSIFSYSQRFTIPGTQSATVERRGFVALGELYDYSQRVVFRHEQTLAKPMSDRLNLLRATRAHFGQIFMLYSDPAQTAELLLFGASSSDDYEVTDEYGVLHRISRISDPTTINILSAAMEDKKLIIADGHHRYETALAYSREHAPQSPASSERNSYALPQPAYPEAAVMMTFVNMDSEGLIILPTHRVVFGLKNFSPENFLTRAATNFEIQKLGDLEISAMQQKLSSEEASGTAFVAATRTGRFLLKLKPEATSEILRSLTPRQRQLDIVRLHVLVLDQLLGITPQAVHQEQNVRYIRDAGEAIEQVAEGRADIAFLVNPVPLDLLREIAFAGDVMPQKSTDFYPKLLSGLAIYAFD
jgi:uncharacterized protein (DUF1015 family)